MSNQGEEPMKYGENLFGRRDGVRNPRDLVQPAHGTLGGGAGPRPAAAAAPATTATPPAPAAAPLATGPQPADDGAGSKLIVGPNIKLKGVEIDDCDTLVVEGRVEATMVSRAIQIAENGAFNGKVDVDVAEIRGAFQGEMTARKKLVIHASGRVSGKIRYGKMLVQEGGEMSGDIGALSGSPAELLK
jgi:cytoskeletal protein CcmA (bactofilin family)